MTNEDLAQKIDNVAATIDLLAISTARGFEEVSGRLDKVENRLDNVEDSLNGVNGRLHTVESQMTRMGSQLDTLDAKVTTIETAQNRRLDTLEDKMYFVYAQ